MQSTQKYISLIEYLRLSTKMSRKEAIELLGWSRQRYQEHIGNKRGEKPVTVLQLAKAWGIPERKLSNLVGTWSRKYFLNADELRASPDNE